MTELYEAARRLYREALDDDVVIERAKLLLLDFTSVVLATQRPEHDRRLAQARRGDAPHSVAFELAARDHFLDYDDIYDRGRVHIGPCTWSALLAMPDMAGRDLLAAYAAAATVFGTLGEAAAPWDNVRARNWFLSQALGGFAAAVACALAAKVDPGVAHNALGLAFMQAAGTKEPAAGVGSTSRQIYPAFGALSGVLAYELAARGFEGPAAWAGGTTGFGGVYLGDAEFASRLAGLAAAATPHLVLDIACKPWPSCRSTHRYLHGLSTLLGPEFSPAAGAGGTAGPIDLTALSADVWLFEPVAGRVRPATIPDGRYSIPFVLAMALTNGVRLSAWSDEALRDPQVIEMATALSDGSTLSDRAELRRQGSAPVECAQPAARDWDLDAAVTKFHECADYAGTLSGTARDRLLDDVLRLDRLGSVHESAVGAALLAGSR